MNTTTKNRDGEMDLIEEPAVSLPVSMASQLTRAEIEQQMDRADLRPRSVSRAAKNIAALATLSEAAAAECGYALPRGNKPVLGPSIRLAEIVASQWGNARVGARVVHVDRIEKYVEAEGIFHDLETNVATTARVRRRIVDRQGRLFNDDMIIVTGNAAASIAKRNAVFAAVPKAVWMEAYEAALQVMRGDAKTMSERKDMLFRGFAAFGVKPELVAEYLQIEDAGDVTVDHCTTLAVILRALKSGDAQVEEYFDMRDDTKKATGATGGQKKAAPKSMADIEAEGDGAAVKDTAGKEDARASSASDPGAPSDEGDSDAGEPDKGPDDKAGGAPDDAAIETAYQDGKKAHARGTTLPKKYRDNEDLQEAWTRGFEAAEDAAASN